VYADPRVADFVTERFVPVRVHAKENREAFERLGQKYTAPWTPTILVLDTDGQERHRIEGFLPADEFIPQLALGAAHAAFKRGDYQNAERLYRDVVKSYDKSTAAPEALYWAGVSKYRASNDPQALKATAEAFNTQYRDSIWATKGSVWR
jgi:TolA-binding protein